MYGEVYDFTDFLDEHPAGAEAILKYGGTDGTGIFDSVHSRDMLDDFDAYRPPRGLTILVDFFPFFHQKLNTKTRSRVAFAIV